MTLRLSNVVHDVHRELRSYNQDIIYCSPLLVEPFVSVWWPLSRVLATPLFPIPAITTTALVDVLEMVAHIFPREHDIEWVRKGYPSKITDTPDEACMGGPIKIDTVQNVITLRSDLHDAWDNYEFGVDPNNNYRITGFTNGIADNGYHN